MAAQKNGKTTLFLGLLNNNDVSKRKAHYTGKHGGRGRIQKTHKRGAVKAGRVKQPGAVVEQDTFEAFVSSPLHISLFAAACLLLAWIVKRLFF